MWKTSGNKKTTAYVVVQCVMCATMKELGGAVMQTNVYEYLYVGIVRYGAKVHSIFFINVCLTEIYYKIILKLLMA